MHVIALVLALVLAATAQDAATDAQVSEQSVFTHRIMISGTGDRAAALVHNHSFVRRAHLHQTVDIAHQHNPTLTLIVPPSHARQQLA